MIYFSLDLAQMGRRQKKRGYILKGLYFIIYDYEFITPNLILYQYVIISNNKVK